MRLLKPSAARSAKGGPAQGCSEETMAVDFGRKAYIDLMASKDPAIRRLVEEGYEFVTNAFTPDAKSADLRVKDAQIVALQLTQEGYSVELCLAYNEKGDPIPMMQSVWRKHR